MRASARRRPLRRARIAPPLGLELDTLALGSRYVGSSEHKSYLSPAGPPRLRADATRCDPDVATFEELTEWLRDAIRRGDIGGPWEGDFPRYVWYRREESCYEGRLVNREAGEYKGYPLRAEEAPE